MKDLYKVILREEAVKMFEQDYLPGIRQTEKKYNSGRSWVDGPMRREGWNNFTDYLCKAGQISDWQYENWSQPECCEREVALYKTTPGTRPLF